MKQLLGADEVGGGDNWSGLSGGGSGSYSGKPRRPGGANALVTLTLIGILLYLTACGGVTPTQTQQASPPLPTPTTAGAAQTAPPNTSIPPTEDLCNIASLSYNPVRAESTSLGIEFRGGGQPSVVYKPFNIDQSNVPDLEHAGVSLNMTLSGNCEFKAQGSDATHFFPFQIFNPTTGALGTSTRAERNPDITIGNSQLYQTNIYLGGQLGAVQILEPGTKRVLFTIDLPDPFPLPDGAVRVFTPLPNLLTQTQIVLQGNANLKPRDNYFAFVSHSGGNFYTTCYPQYPNQISPNLVCPIKDITAGTEFNITPFFGILGDGFEDHPLMMVSLKIPIPLTPTKDTPTEVYSTKTPVSPPTQKTEPTTTETPVPSATNTPWTPPPLESLTPVQ